MVSLEGYHSLHNESVPVYNLKHRQATPVLTFRILSTHRSSEVAPRDTTTDMSSAMATKGYVMVAGGMKFGWQVGEHAPNPLACMPSEITCDTLLGEGAMSFPPDSWDGFVLYVASGAVYHMALGAAQPALAMLMEARGLLGMLCRHHLDGRLHRWKLRLASIVLWINITKPRDGDPIVNVVIPAGPPGWLYTATNTTVFALAHRMPIEDIFRVEEDTEEALGHETPTKAKRRRMDSPTLLSQETTSPPLSPRPGFFKAK